MIEGWIRHSFPDFALDFSWKMAHPEVLVLYGASGAGKTTVLRVIAGLVKPEAGRILIDDLVVHDIDKQIWVPPQNRRIGYVPQINNVFPHLTVEQNVSYGVKNDQKDRVSSLLRSFDLESLKRRRPQNLSGGERQRTAIARALAPLPKLLLFDEPFMGMDAEHRGTFKNELSQVTHRFAVPVIVVTHLWEEALSIADNVLVIDKGRSIDHVLRAPISTDEFTPTQVKLHSNDNRYKGLVGSNNPSEPTMICTVSGVDFMVGRTGAPPGDTIYLTLCASDVIVALEKPQGVSIENVIAGTIVEIIPLDGGVILRVDAGVEVRAQVAEKFVRDLDLTVGGRIWVLIKANSFQIGSPN